MIVCAPTQHLKCLNPHLDHAAFDAFFASEANPYLYNAGHAQVSSFGVGGTNGHAIFWGEKTIQADVDNTKLFLRKLRRTPCPINADGSNPAAWDYARTDP